MSSSEQTGGVVRRSAPGAPGQLPPAARRLHATGPALLALALLLGTSQAMAAPTTDTDGDFFQRNASAPGVVLLAGGAQGRRLQAADGASAAEAQFLVLDMSSHVLGQASPEVPAEMADRMRKGQRLLMEDLPAPIADAVRHMHVGERWQVWVPAGQQPGEPARAYEIELMAAH